MKSIHALSKLASGLLAAGLLIAMPTAAAAASQLKTDHLQAHTTIEEWHWRNMAL